jgi:hypothetical protein
MAWRQEADVLKWWLVVAVAAITGKAALKVVGKKLGFPPVIQGIIEA